jgi:hypothetical protein
MLTPGSPCIRRGSCRFGSCAPVNISHANPRPCQRLPGRPNDNIASWQMGQTFDASLALEFLGFSGPEAIEGLASHLEKPKPSFPPTSAM